MNRKHCEHVRQRESDAAIIMGPVATADDLLPCATPDCPAGAKGHSLLTPNADGTWTKWRRVPTDGGWLWLRVTGTARLGDVR